MLPMIVLQGVPGNPEPFSNLSRTGSGWVPPVAPSDHVLVRGGQNEALMGLEEVYSFIFACCLHDSSRPEMTMPAEGAGWRVENWGADQEPLPNSLTR
jgi:hypothetical protein